MYAARAQRSSLSPEERNKFYDLALENIDRMAGTDREDTTNSIHWLASKGWVLTRRGRPLEAIPCFERVIAFSGEEGTKESKGHLCLPRDMLFELTLLLAEAHEAAGQYREAFAVYVPIGRKGSELKAEQMHKAFMGTSRCLYHMKDYRNNYELAKEAGKTALSANRHFKRVHRLVALPQRELGDLDGAIATMSRAVLYESPGDADIQEENRKILAELIRQKEDQ